LRNIYSRTKKEKLGYKRNIGLGGEIFIYQGMRKKHGKRRIWQVFSQPCDSQAFHHFSFAMLSI
jgi:hypothetical protein